MLLFNWKCHYTTFNGTSFHLYLKTGKEHVMNNSSKELAWDSSEPSWDAIDLIGSLTRSKAIWKNPELLNLVESTPSPNKAFNVVLQRTGSRKKALAARWYRIAMRDYGEQTPGALVSILELPQGVAQLEMLLTKTPTTSLKMG